MDEPQFDSTLGGAEHLPFSLHLPKFVAHRSQEIQIMKKTLTLQTSTKLAFQTLPKHMRRRAMAHNVRRLPRRLRQIHINQMAKSGTPSKAKRPSRKFRRRPSNLLLEYQRRGAKHRWLRTHIWHAKRFHMVEKWDYKIPCHPREKSFRACYRAIAKHSLLQDISFISCVEISALNRESLLKPLKTITRTETGLTIGARTFVSGCRECTLMLFNSDKDIGTVYANWCPEVKDNSVKLWLWIHAAFYEEALQTLRSIYETGESPNKVVLQELREDLTRFRLVGPSSLLVLKKSLIPLQFSNVRHEQTWLDSYLQTTDLCCIESQCKIWSQLDSETHTPPNYIYSIIVQDPRCKEQELNQQELQEFSETSPVNPLWEQTFRDAANKEQALATKKNVEIRKNTLVPGTCLGGNNYHVPLIVVQVPGCQNENLGFGGGFDVIIPSAWSRHFWLSFIINGARVGGLREQKNLLFEMGKTQFLRPNSEADRIEEEQTTDRYQEVFFKKPPNKRINYNKFSIARPFKCDWNLLFNEWSQEAATDSFKVVDKKSILQQLQQWLSSKGSRPELPSNCLVPVKITCEGKGIPKQFSIICLPKNHNDLKNTVIEPKVSDKNEKQRRHLRKEHQTMLKKMRKERKLKGKNPEHVEVLKKYQEKMRSLWLPSREKLRHSCSREVMGFVQKGGFRYSIGKPCGIGYVALNALFELDRLPKRNKVLFRNTNSRLYHVAQLEVIVE